MRTHDMFSFVGMSTCGEHMSPHPTVSTEEWAWAKCP